MSKTTKKHGQPIYVIGGKSNPNIVPQNKLGTKK